MLYDFQIVWNQNLRILELFDFNLKKNNISYLNLTTANGTMLKMLQILRKAYSQNFPKISNQF